MYVAYAGPDDYVESGVNLERLIRVLSALVDPGSPDEDIAIWQDDARLVAVILADGHVVRFDRQRPVILPFPTNGRVRT